MFIMLERRKSKHNFGRTKVCKAEEVRTFFVNPKIENEVSVQITSFVVWISEIFHSSLVIACENDERCYFVACIGSPTLISIYCLCFVSFCLFLFFLIFYVDSTTCQSIKASLVILKIKQWSCSQILGGVSRGELFQSYLVINVTVFVQFGKKFSYILPLLALQNELLQTISVKLISVICQFLCLINGYLFFRCLEKVIEEDRSRNKERNSRGVATTQLTQKEDRKLKDRDDEIRGFDLVFVGQNNTDFNYISCNYWLL